MSKWEREDWDFLFRNDEEEDLQKDISESEAQKEEGQEGEEKRKKQEDVREEQHGEGTPTMDDEPEGAPAP